MTRTTVPRRGRLDSGSRASHRPAPTTRARVVGAAVLMYPARPGTGSARARQARCAGSAAALRPPVTAAPPVFAWPVWGRSAPPLLEGSTRGSAPQVVLDQPEQQERVDPMLLGHRPSASGTPPTRGRVVHASAHSMPSGAERASIARCGVVPAGWSGEQVLLGGADDAVAAAGGAAEWPAPRGRRGAGCAPAARDRPGRPERLGRRLRFIATVPGRGYRFLPTGLGDADAPPPRTARHAARPRATPRRARVIKRSSGPPSHPGILSTRSPTPRAPSPVRAWPGPFRRTGGRDATIGELPVWGGGAARGKER